MMRLALRIAALAVLFQGCSSPRHPADVWDAEGPVPAAADQPRLKGVRFQIIKPYEFALDGYRFLHGVALARHEGRLYASFGHNRGGENTSTEEARYTVSEDEGRTWSPVRTIDGAPAPEVGVSHGVMLSHGGRLWAFHGAYRGTLADVHTRAYVLQPDGSWKKLGTVVGGGFWPLEPPRPLGDGNWIMSGASVGGQNPPAVAISRGDDFTRWDLVRIPMTPGLGSVWGESAIVVDGKSVHLYSRYGQKAQLLTSVSRDRGRTWTALAPSDLPMAASKPAAGMLSDGRRYLVGSISGDGGNRRSPLCIAVSRPGEEAFSSIFVIRDALHPGGPGESHAKAALAYPCALELDGFLYVGYSNSGGGLGRAGTGRELWNNNSAELAVIPLDALR
jgi:hypothetical protein